MNQSSPATSPIDISQWPSLSFSYLFSSQNNIPALQLSFCFDKSPYESGGEEAQQKAIADLRFYSVIFNIFSQTEKLKMSYCSSIDGSATNKQGSLRTIDVKDFMEQLINPIIGFLKNISKPSDQTVLAPIPFPYTIQSEITPASIENYTDLFQLTVSIVIEAELTITGEPGPKLVTQNIPVQAQLSDSTSVKDVKDSLLNFAQQFEILFLNLPEKGNSLKIAHGLFVQNEKTNAISSLPIWIMRFDENGINGVKIVSQNADAVYYAPLPLAQNLLTINASIAQYETGKSFPAGAAQSVVFSGTDADTWNNTALTAIDKFLSPEYASAADLLDEGVAVQELIKAKEIIAAAFSQRVATISASQNRDASGVANAQVYWKKHLSNQLSNAYKNAAMIQSEVSVKSSWTNTAIAIPSLTGIIAGTNSSPSEGDTLSSANLGLANGTSFLTYFFDSSSQEQWRNLSFTGMNFSVNGISCTDEKGNPLTLAFVIPPAAIAENDITIPIPLRAMAGPSEIKSQDFDYPGEIGEISSIQNARQWKYNLEYITHSSAVQDTFRLQLNFNVKDQQLNSEKKLQSGMTPAFTQALAQFISAYPSISADLDKYLLAVTQKSVNSNSAEITNAVFSVQAFVSIVKAFSSSWNISAPAKTAAPEKSQDAQMVYTITESKDVSTGNLLISVLPDSANQPLCGGTISIPGYTAIPGNKNANVFQYADSEGKMLSFDQRTENSSRNFSPDYILDILNEENVFAKISVTRNENLFGNAIDGWNASNEEFIYYPPSGSLKNSLVPSFVYEPAINIATIVPGFV